MWYWRGGKKNQHFCFHRYEEAEVRKKLEERDRQELQKKQEPKDDGKSSAKTSSESTVDCKGKSQRVIKDFCKFSSSVVVLIYCLIFITYLQLRIIPHCFVVGCFCVINLCSPLPFQRKLRRLSPTNLEVLLKRNFERSFLLLDFLLRHSLTCFPPVVWESVSAGCLGSEY